MKKVLLTLILSISTMFNTPVFPASPGKWAADRIIDIHGHIGSFSGYEIGVDPLLANIRRYGLLRVLVSNIDGAALPGTTRDLGEVEANKATAAALGAHPELLGIAWARPGADGSRPENLEPFLASGFVAIKLHPRFNNFPADAAFVDPYLQLAERHGVPVVIHCDDPDPIYRLARRHPRVPVILYHSGFFTDHQAAIRVVEAAQRDHTADLYLETAQVEPDSVLEMVKRVGAGRVIFGTDATYFGKDHYSHYVPMVDLLRKKLKPEEFRMVMEGNARRVFKLRGDACEHASVAPARRMRRVIHFGFEIEVPDGWNHSTEKNGEEAYVGPEGQDLRLSVYNVEPVSTVTERATRLAEVAQRGQVYLERFAAERKYSVLSAGPVRGTVLPLRIVRARSGDRREFFGCVVVTGSRNVLLVTLGGPIENRTEAQFDELVRSIRETTDAATSGARPVR